MVVYAIIMAGGKGERFWPLSRAAKPKQFLPLTSSKTMLAETIERVRPMIPLERMYIVTSESMYDMALKAVDDLTGEHILVEPYGRNTGLAIGLAATHLLHEDPGATMVVLSADHLIRPAEKLLKILQDGCDIAANDDVLITVGIVPTRPETGYGYIKLGDAYNNDKGRSAVYRVSAFTEKPKLVMAREYYYSRKYLWNAGIFIWSAKAILNALHEYQPEMYSLLMDYSSVIGTDQEQSGRLKLYQEAPEISVDYAVLEHARNVLTVKADIVWDDVGSWIALERYKGRDVDNNLIVGEAVLIDSFETTVYNDSKGIVACLGLSDLVIVRASNITFISHRTKLDQIKELLAKLDEDENTRCYL